MMSHFIENFAPLKILGTGAYGKVYQVKRNVDQKLFAIKKIIFESE